MKHQRDEILYFLLFLLLGPVMFTLLAIYAVHTETAYSKQDVHAMNRLVEKAMATNEMTPQNARKMIYLYGN